MSKIVRKYNIPIVLGLLIVLVGIEMSNLSFHSNGLASSMIEGSVTRFLGGFIFLILLYSYGYTYITNWKTPWKVLIVIFVPAFLISINNLPLSAYIDGRATINHPDSFVLLFLLETIATGFFEELVFRGLLLVVLLQQFEKQKNGIFKALFLSSAIFGGIHLINIAMGAGVYNTILQVGYSFLMGLLWGTVFLKTRNIWLVIFLHASYNFCGQVFFQLGTVIRRYDTMTLILTIGLGFIVAVHMLYQFMSLNMKELNELV